MGKRSLNSKKANRTPRPGRYRRQARAITSSVVLFAVVLLAAGWGHRALVGKVNAALSTVMQPKQPLASLPHQLGNWLGTDVPIDVRALRVTWFDDDYVNRTYANQQTGSVVGVFVGYVGRPRTHLGHRPDVCLAAQGWEQVSQEPLRATIADGHAVPCLLYEFNKPSSFAPPLLVLATYMINGRYFESPDDLDRWHARSPGLLGERPAYLTRVQLSKPVSANRHDDLEMLMGLLTCLAQPTAERMPYWEHD